MVIVSSLADEKNCSMRLRCLIGKPFLDERSEGLLDSADLDELLLLITRSRIPPSNAPVRAGPQEVGARARRSNNQQNSGSLQASQSK